jgi:hypothetical protein
MIRPSLVTVDQSGEDAGGGETGRLHGGASGQTPRRAPTRRRR